MDTLKTDAIEVNQANGGGVLVRKDANAVIIRRNPHHPEQLTTLRFIRAEGSGFQEGTFSPLVFPFNSIDHRPEQHGQFGWGCSVYLWLVFGNDIPTHVPEPAWGEINRFSQFLAACLDENTDSLDGSGL